MGELNDTYDALLKKISTETGVKIKDTMMLFQFYYVLLADLSDDDHHFNISHDDFL